MARTFVEAGLEAIKMPQIDASEMGAGFGEFKSLAKLEAKPIKAGHKVVTGMRGSYGGVLMFGMLTSFAGLGMFNPLSLGAGLLLGRKAYKDDMENRMMRVRNEAKMNMRRFVDDVSFVVNKESRDRLKGIQRQLRDHYRGIANQTTRSLNESLQATIASAQLEENERNTRIRRTRAAAQHSQTGDRSRGQVGARRHRSGPRTRGHDVDHHPGSPSCRSSISPLACSAIQPVSVRLSTTPTRRSKTPDFPTPRPSKSTTFSRWWPSPCRPTIRCRRSCTPPIR